jgi:xanthosine utilization system XapX-like protein
MIRSARQIWAAPVLLAVLTLVGLVAALLGDGIWDLVSALTLGAPVAAGVWFSLRRRVRRS